MTPERERARRVLELLEPEHPDAGTPLSHSSAWELLVATILSAQCTDGRVNEVTPGLFSRYPDARAMAGADRSEIEELIRPTGFFRNKAKALVEASGALVERHGGRVPDDMEALTALPGVGRKTANVILGAWFDRPAIIVDTHLGRVVRRLGFTRAEKPEQVEREIRSLVPENLQTRFSMVVNFHGRRTCRSRKPECRHCVVRELCPYPDKEL